MSIATTTDANGRLLTASSGGGGASLTDAVILAPDSDNRNRIIPTAADVVGMVHKGAPGQTDNLEEWRRAADNFLAWYMSPDALLLRGYNLTIDNALNTQTLGVAGSATVNGVLGQQEIADPGNAAANNYVLFARDNGAGKTQICVKFPTGATIVLATEA